MNNPIKGAYKEFKQVCKENDKINAMPAITQSQQADKHKAVIAARERRVSGSRNATIAKLKADIYIEILDDDFFVEADNQSDYDLVDEETLRYRQYYGTTPYAIKHITIKKNYDALDVAKNVARRLVSRGKSVIVLPDPFSKEILFS